MLLTFSLLVFTTSTALFANSLAVLPTSAVSASAMGSFFFLRTSPFGLALASAFFFSAMSLALLPDDHVPAVAAGHRSLDDQDVLVAVHPHHGQVLLRDPVRAHVSGGAHALEHAAGEGRRADGAGRAVEHRSVRGRASAEVVALDHALEALALAGADDVDGVTRLEDLDRDLVADLGLVAVLQAQLAQHLHRRQVAARRLEVAGLGLGHLLDLAVLDQAELHRLVAVCHLARAGVAGLLVLAGRGAHGFALALHHDAGTGLDDGGGDGPP